MYTPTHFSVSDPTSALRLMRDHPFATLISAGPEGVIVSHLPLLTTGEPGALVLLGHVARANPHAAEIDRGTPTIAIFHGPHGYVSPSWYDAKLAVPTWNYAAVHAHGVPEPVRDHDGMCGMMRRLTDAHERAMPRPWRMELPDSYMNPMLEAILCFTLPVARLEAKFKLSQNRPGADRARVRDAFSARGEHELAALMQEISKP